MTVSAGHRAPRRRSRLDSFIARLRAQRVCLDAAAALVRELPGPVLELGLGNGRTYDHLRALCPDRAIFVFDRHRAAHPDSTPDSSHFILGDFSETLPAALARTGAPAALAHCDIGSGDREATGELAAWLGPVLAPLMASGGVIVADQPLSASALSEVALPEGVAPERYFMYRAGTIAP